MLFLMGRSFYPHEGALGNGSCPHHPRRSSADGRRFPAGRVRRAFLAQHPPHPAGIYPRDRPCDLGDRQEVRNAGSDRALDEIERLASWLDDRFRVPGTNIRFGLDALIGLVPGVGDSATFLVSAWLIVRARSLGLPGGVVARMALNVAIDLVIGTIPLLGDLFDLGFKANRRNVALVRRHLERRAQAG